MSEKQSFWSTIPGLITGIATILTALLALIPLFNSFGSGSDPEPTDSPSPTATSTASPGRGKTGGSSSSAGGGPQAVIAPKTVEFGRLGSGRTTSQTVTVANTGSESLVVEEAIVTGGDGQFSVEAAPCLNSTGIEPGSDCEMTVTFAPKSPGNYAGFLEIEHSAASSAERVALSGEGALLGL